MSRSSDQSVCLSLSVDEYVSIAKDKHGYNVEQVGSPSFSLTLV